MKRPYIHTLQESLAAGKSFKISLGSTALQLTSDSPSSLNHGGLKNKQSLWRRALAHNKLSFIRSANFTTHEEKSETSKRNKIYNLEVVVARVDNDIHIKVHSKKNVPSLPS